MKNYLFVLFLISSIIDLIAQTVSGKIVNQTGQALSGLQCKLYIAPKIFETLNGNDLGLEKILKGLIKSKVAIKNV